MALDAVVREHEALRYRFHPHADGSWGVTSAEPVQALLVVAAHGSGLADKLVSGEVGHGELAQLVTFTPESNCRLIAYLVPTDPCHSTLLLLVDHLVCDSFSSQVLLAALGEHYRSGTDPSLVTVDRSGRAALGSLREVFDTMRLSARQLAHGDALRRGSPIAWVDLQARVPWTVPAEDAVARTRSMGVTAADFSVRCAALRASRFAFYLATTNRTLADLGLAGGHLYLYPSLREGLDLGPAVGWLSGTAIVEVPETQPASRAIAAARTAVAIAMTDGWAVWEKLSELADTHRRSATAASVSLIQYEDHALPDIDFGSASGTHLPKVRHFVPVRGRIALAFGERDGTVELSVAYEPSRFEKSSIDELIEALAAQFQHLVAAV